MMNRLKLFIPFAIFAVLAMFFWRGLSLDPSAMPSALLDKPFPEFTLAALSPLQSEAATVSRSDLLGHVSLVNVWATWCAACKYEHPVLNQLSEKGVRIVGINYKDNTLAAQQWLQDLGDPYEFTIVDPDGRLGIDLGVFGAPETYLVDKQGLIRYKHVGIVDMVVWDTLLQPLYERYSQ